MIPRIQHRHKHSSRRAPKGIPRRILALGAGALVVAVSGVPMLAEEVVGKSAARESAGGEEWTFRDGLSGWTAAMTTPLEAREGALQFRAAGHDPILLSPEIVHPTSPLDVVELRLRASVTGRWELFWRRDREGPFGGFSQERSLAFEVERGDALRTVRIRPYWHAEGPVLGIRIDPPGGDGKFALERVRVAAGGGAGSAGDAAAAPVVRFDFASAGADPGRSAVLGWTAEPPARLRPSNAGLELVLPDRSARLVSPPLSVDAALHRYLAIDATVLEPSRAGDTFEGRIEFAVAERRGVSSRSFRLPGGRRCRAVVSVAALPAWRGTVAALLLAPSFPETARIVVHSIELLAEPGGRDIAHGPASDGPATGLEFQSFPIVEEGRRPVASGRIDLESQPPPPTKPVESDFTVAMWYFAAWEPEYAWDGWKPVAERAPWRIPLLYDSADPAMEFHGIRYYRSSHPRAIDWHVHWMREHAVNLILWDWYPRSTEDGDFDPGFFGNRALETGFLGKAELGGPPVATNRFAGKIDFAVMWTNHPPFQRVGRGIGPYIVEQFFRQPNYYRLDGKPLLILWSPASLIEGTGSEEGARRSVDAVREAARERGLDAIYIAGVVGPDGVPLVRSLGLDGVVGYHYEGSGGHAPHSRAVGDRVVEDQVEDYPTQTIPGHGRIWRELSDALGRDYLLATTPMQNWEPTLRPVSYVQRRANPDAYREMLHRARSFIEARKLRRFVSVEAWNEWLEGSYVEPSTQWGTGWLEAIRDVFARPAPEGEPRPEPPPRAR